MKVSLIKGLSKKDNIYYQILIQCNRFFKYVFISDIEAAYLIQENPDIEIIDHSNR